MQFDYYKILSVSRDASDEQIKKSFYNLAKIYHPDVCKLPDAKRRFQQINNAYQVLNDPKKRQWYDTKLKYGTYNIPKKPYTDFRKYGTKVRDNSYYSAYENTRREGPVNKLKIEKYISDKFLFASLFILGIITIILGLIDIFFKEKKEGDPINFYGLLFGIVFTSLLIYGWKMIKKK